MEIAVAEREFTVEAPQQRVWDQLARASLNSVEGMEQIEFIDEENFTAKVRLKLALVSLSVPLKGKILEASPIERLVVALQERVAGGIIELKQKTAFTLLPESEGRTKVVCKAVTEMSTAVLRWALLWKVRSVAEKGLVGIEEQLKKLS